MTKSEAIERIRRRFHREWLLIAVERMNPRTQAPIRGRLLAHSRDRDDIYNKMMRRKGLTLVAYSDDRLPAGYATAF